MKPQAPGAVSGLTFGILGLMFWMVPVLGLLLGVVAICYAHRARRILSQGDTYDGSGLAAAGMVSGIIVTVFSLLWNILLFLILVLVAAAIASASAHAGGQLDPDVLIPRL